jgi:PPOX class probable F420-dependent enzyme
MIRTSGWAADAVALETFLEEPNLARLGTVDADGAIHIVPVWYHWDGRRYLIGAQAGDHKVTNVRRYRRASLVIDGDIRRKRGILVRGVAGLIEGPAGRDAYTHVSEAQVRRYQPDRPPLDTARRMAAKGEPVVIVIAPASIVSWGR